MHSLNFHINNTQKRPVVLYISLLKWHTYISPSEIACPQMSTRDYLDNLLCLLTLTPDNRNSKIVDNSQTNLCNNSKKRSIKKIKHFARLPYSLIHMGINNDIVKVKSTYNVEYCTDHLILKDVAELEAIWKRMNKSKGV